MSIQGRPFWKMTGSGNDFVFFDARENPPGVLETRAAIDALCARRTGIGADGVVFLERDPIHSFGIRYFNRDGSLAELCGNASLCSVTLARTLGVVPEGSDFTFQTSSGPLKGRVINGIPEIEIASVTEQKNEVDIPRQVGEQRIGFARVGVPHLVVLVNDVASVDVEGRGRELRNWPTLRDGANANFVAPHENGWIMRTYERGVEAETLACGTGAVATASLLGAWNLAPDQVTLVTRSAAPLIANIPRSTAQQPSLRGEGRLVFSGAVGDLGLPVLSTGKDS
ncbi:MAG: diaminopimelate epimerase [Gemmatimonadaceae bacterium]